MESAALNGYRTFPVVNFVRARGAGKLMVPVASQDAMYARFKHIAGFPEPTKGTGYSISRIRVLDILIDRLNSISRDEVRVDSEVLTDDRVEAMISELSDKLQTELKKAAPIATGVDGLRGAAVNFMAG